MGFFNKLGKLGKKVVETATRSATYVADTVETAINTYAPQKEFSAEGIVRTALESHRGS